MKTKAVLSMDNTHWKTMLRQAEYPTTVVVLDFETYFDSDFNLNKISTLEYIMDERFEVLGLSSLRVTEDSPSYVQRTQWWTGDRGTRYCLKQLQERYGKHLEGCTVVAHNAKFDVAILVYRFGVQPRYVVDTKGMAQHWHSRQKNNLSVLATQHGLPEKGDTLNFKEWTFRCRWKPGKKTKKKKHPPKRLPRITPEGVDQLAAYAKNDVMREWEIFTILAPLVSSPYQELRACQHTMELFWYPVLEIDQAKADDLMQRMDAEIDAAVKQAGVTRTEASGNKSFEALLCTALKESGDNPAHYMKQGKKGPLLAIAKDDPQREELVNHFNPTVRDLLAARTAVKTWPLHIQRVQRIANQAKAAGGKLPVPLQYHGAHTGRWSGTESINLQNLGTRGNSLVNAVRELIVAPKGCKLIIADASQIEARMLAWAAHEEWLLQAFRNNEGIYAQFAAKVLGQEVRKPKVKSDGTYDGDPEVEGWYKWARNGVGKIGILGCGYGMGPGNSATEQVNSMFQSAGIDWATAVDIVETYRQENRAIVRFWHDLERAFRLAAKYGRATTMNRELVVKSHPSCDVMIVLPNGRELKYHTVRAHDGDLQVWNNLKKVWTHIWGGHLVENVIQAMARDVLWQAIWSLELDGYHTALHVHDELVLCVDENDADSALDHATTVLRTPPEWASDCPLDAEGAITDRYGGH